MTHIDTLKQVREAQDRITGLSRALRSGGPDPIDLHDLSDSLEEAVNLAHETITSLTRAIEWLEKQEPAAWQERQSRRVNKDGEITEWSPWYESKGPSPDYVDPENPRIEVTYQWRKLYTAPPPPPAQEPVGWLVPEGYMPNPLVKVSGPQTADWQLPVYLAAPQSAVREWVGLTRDDRMGIINRFSNEDWVYALDAVDEHLREKNGGSA